MKVSGTGQAQARFGAPDLLDRALQGTERCCDSDRSIDRFGARRDNRVQMNKLSASYLRGVPPAGHVLTRLPQLGPCCQLISLGFGGYWTCKRQAFNDAFNGKHLDCSCRRRLAGFGESFGAGYAFMNYVRATEGRFEEVLEHALQEGGRRTAATREVRRLYVDFLHKYSIVEPR